MYPWRSATPDPYRVLVSEVMLHQTQAARVARAFTGFLRRFPTVADLAAAPRSAVLRAWSGLGYNRRAGYLSEAARLIVREHGAQVPSAPEILRTLPGIGPYTSAAVASIAFGVPVAALDTNVARVVARFRLEVEPREVPRANLEAAAVDWLDQQEPGAWNQALMDLGREVCRADPHCNLCPLSPGCGFRAAGRSRLPSLRRESPFPQSLRRVRGAVIRALVGRPSASIDVLSREAGESPDRIAEAVRALARDGLVDASPAALNGQLRGRLRLAGD
jgi:A/G-specific adenine glycosylase